MPRFIELISYGMRPCEFLFTLLVNCCSVSTVLGVFWMIYDGDLSAKPYLIILFTFLHSVWITVIVILFFLDILNRLNRAHAVLVHRTIASLATLSTVSLFGYCSIQQLSAGTSPNIKTVLYPHSYFYFWHLIFSLISLIGHLIKGIRNWRRAKSRQYSLNAAIQVDEQQLPRTEIAEIVPEQDSVRSLTVSSVAVRSEASDSILSTSSGYNTFASQISTSSGSSTLISLSVSTLNASNDWSVEGAVGSGILPSTPSSSRRTHSSSIASSQRPYDAVADLLQSNSDASSVRTISTMSSTYL